MPEGEYSFEGKTPSLGIKRKSLEEQFYKVNTLPLSWPVRPKCKYPKISKNAAVFKLKKDSIFNLI